MRGPFPATPLDMTPGKYLPWLRAEGLTFLIGGLTAFFYSDVSAWWLLLFLAPDLAMIAYAAGPRSGMVAYNLVHTYAVPVLAGLVLYALGLEQLALAGSGMWIAHIGMDRMLGYGLKGARSFHETHLGWIGTPTPREGDPAG